MRVWSLLIGVGLLGACAQDNPTAIVAGVLAPEEDCSYSSSSEVFLLDGAYDISPGTDDVCQKPYQAGLQVNSFLIARGSPQGPPPRAETAILQMNTAEVSLKAVDGSLIAIGGGKLPNPFSVTTHATIFPAADNSPGRAVASVELIPAAYAQHLAKFASPQQTITADITLFGRTTGGIDIETADFQFPISICDGCLTMCQAQLDALDDTQRDVILAGCQDNASADGRFCIDASPGCAP